MTIAVDMGRKATKTNKQTHAHMQCFKTMSKKLRVDIKQIAYEMLKNDKVKKLKS